MATLKSWIWLTTRKGLEGLNALAVLEHFSSPEHAYHADREEYKLIGHLTSGQIESLMDKDTSQADQILADCDRLGLRILTIQDVEYPERLRQLPDAPVVLYIRGKLPHFDEEAAIAIVGARKATDYGIRVAEQLGYEIAQGGGLVVSGIAEGIDCAAVRGALRAGKPVVSLLAGGVDMPFPPENRFLHEDVAAAGALISEYPPGTLNKGHHFPIRNRIISGLCLGVIAVECQVRGGTMRTVSSALEQNRDVFAVPGNIDAPMSRGTNLLIQQGAKLILNGEHVLEEYRGDYPLKLAGGPRLDPDVMEQRLQNTRKQSPERARQASAPEPVERPVIPVSQQKERFTDDQLALLRALSQRPMTSDELVEFTQIPVRRVSSALTMLQIGDGVKEGANRTFYPLITLELEKTN